MKYTVHELIHCAALPAYPADPLFGLLADTPGLADEIDAVIAERKRRSFSCGERSGGCSFFI